MIRGSGTDPSGSDSAGLFHVASLQPTKRSRRPAEKRSGDGSAGDKDAESHVEGLCVVTAKGRVSPWLSGCVCRYRHLQVILQDPRCLADPFEIDDHACLRRWLIQREWGTSDVLRHENTVRGVEFRVSIEVVKDQGLKIGLESRRKGIITRKFFRSSPISLRCVHYVPCNPNSENASDS